MSVYQFFIALLFCSVIPIAIDMFFIEHDGYKEEEVGYKDTNIHQVVHHVFGK